MNKYEQLMEYIINDETEKARSLFHDIVVARSREIYESLMDEDPAVQDDQVESLVDEITADETGMHEDEMDLDMGDEAGIGGVPGDDLGMDHEHGDEGEEDIEDRVMDLESALDELKAEFEKLMGDEANEPEHHDGIDDPDFGASDDEGDEDESDEEEMSESKEEEDDEEEEDESAVEESRSNVRKMSEAERLREYVDKVSDGHGAEKKGAGEGHEVGKGGSVSVNKQGIVAKKNDMGGSAANIVRGGSEQAPDGTTPKGKAGGFVKSAQEIDVAKRNVNKVGGNKGAQDFYSSKAKGKAGEGQTTDGSVAVNKKSIEGGSR